MKNKFQCKKCGSCCRNEISYVEILDKDLVKWRKRGILDGLISYFSTTTEFPSGYIIDFDNFSGRCPFLDLATNLCVIHSKFGKKMKPFFCLTFGEDKSMKCKQQKV